MELRREVIATCREMSALGYCIYTWGNISVRLTNGIMVTPSRLDYATMTENDLVVVNLDGEKLSGSRIPSSETMLHCGLLAARADIPVWIHTHAPNASALACMHSGFPVIVEDMAQIIGGPVGCGEYQPGGRHRKLADAAVSALHPESCAVLLANHGVVVGGRSLSEALVATQVLEKAAGIWLAGGEKIVPIPEELVREERNRFLYKYGKE